MKILCWNVNGVRAAQRKGFLKWLAKEKPDALCLQETKARPEQLDEELLNPPGYETHWNWAEKPGYSGTAIYTKQKPLSVSRGIGIKKHDQEGRVLTAEYDDFSLVNVYVPNSKDDLSRLPYRFKEWDVEFLSFLKKLEKKKPVVVCGDFNVAHKEIDLSRPKENEFTHGFTKEERAGFDNFVKAGLIDTFREFCTDGGHYTWWHHFNNCRARNIGWRIDYFLISKALRPKLKDAFIMPDVMGSDHCPVGIDLKF